jgi:hypothetical protein
MGFRATWHDEFRDNSMNHGEFKVHNLNGACIIYLALRANVPPFP